MVYSSCLVLLSSYRCSRLRSSGEHSFDWDFHKIVPVRMSRVKEVVWYKWLSLFLVSMCMCSILLFIDSFYHFALIVLIATIWKKSRITPETSLTWLWWSLFIQNILCGRKLERRRERKRKCKSNPFFHFSLGRQRLSCIQDVFFLDVPLFQDCQKGLVKIVRKSQAREKTWQMINERLIVNEDWWHEC